MLSLTLALPLISMGPKRASGPASAVSETTRARSELPALSAILHRRIGIAVVLELVERGLAAGLQQRAIERLTRLERQRVLQCASDAVRGKRFEAVKDQPLDHDGLVLRRCSP